MTRTGAAAQSAARSITRGYGGLCLKFVRTAFDVPAKYPTARAARQGSQHFHGQSNPNAIPANVPVYLGDNHVAFSVGNGRMITTNSATNRVSETSIQSWINAGFRLHGWAEDLNGVRVYSAPAAPSAPPAGSPYGVLKIGSTGPAVSGLQEGLNRVFPSYSNLSRDGQYGPATAKVVTEFQRRVGLARDGVVGPNTRAALAKHGITF